MTPERRNVLDRVARACGTPCYVYFADDILRRFDRLSEAFGGRFGISYAVKSNPNEALLRAIRDKVETLDVSSIGEAERALAAGYPADRLTFSGPAKRYTELSRAVELGVGEIVCETPWEMDTLNQLAAARGRPLPVFVRINPIHMPRKFGVSMAGKASQFGIDEEDLEDALAHLNGLENLTPAGFHIYSGTNCLDADAIAENLEIFIGLFERAAKSAGIRPKKLIFGSGFGIPYLPDDEPVDLDRLAALVNPMIDALREQETFRDARCVLELGRWLVGPEGYLLTSVINEKRSRGTEIRMCDAGFNNHLSACGMMGTVIRRNWRFWKVNDGMQEPTQKYLLVGPLCTTIDVLATHIELPPIARGDVLAIGMSGAYGLTASPTRFISHPEPQEVVVEGGNADAVLRVSQYAGMSAVTSHDVRLT